MNTYTDYQNDIFISYPRRSDTYGWVNEFHGQLQVALEQRLGPNVKIWRDVTQLNGSDEWPEEIKKALDNSGIMLPVLLPLYFTRYECTAELSQFLQLMNESGKPGRRKLMPVFQLPADDEQSLPQELTTICRHDFYKADGKYTLELDPTGDKQDYVRRVARVAEDLRVALKELRSTQPPPAAKVFLATTSRSLLQKREQLRSALRQQNIAVVPEHDYIWGTSGVDAKIAGDLADTVLSVHLVARADQPGYDPIDRERKQLEQAILRHQQGRLPAPLVWMCGGEPTDADRQQLLKLIREDFANRGAELMEGAFQDLETQIRTALAPVLAAAAPAPRRVAILTEAGDAAAAAALVALLKAAGHECRRIAFTGDQPQDKGQLDTMASKYSHAIVVWGAAPPSWVEDRLDSPEVAAMKRAGRIGVYLCGESTIAKEDGPPSGVHVIDGLQGPADAAVARFMGAAGAPA